MKNENTQKKHTAVHLIADRLKTACCYFAAFMILPLIFAMDYATPMYIYTMFAFSVALSFIGLVMNIKNVSYLIRLTIHIALTYVVFTLIFLLVNWRSPNGSVFTPTTYAFLAMAIAVLYVIFGTAGYFIKLGRRKEQKEENYDSQFK